MSKIYLVRHQHHGCFTGAAFATAPTEAQLAAVKAHLDQLHGVVGWVRAHEVGIVDGVPNFPSPGAASASRANAANAGDFVVSGTGEVTK